MFHRLILPVTAFEQNCSLVWCDETNEAALIDPGGDIGKLLQAVEERGLTLGLVPAIALGMFGGELAFCAQRTSDQPRSR